MRVQITDVRIYVEVLSDAGSPPGTRPVLLALHGGPGLDHTVLRPGIDGLRDDFQLVLIDQRGHGRSDRDVPANWTLDRWADDVVEVCDALDIHEPIVLGSSFGAAVALNYAARHPAHPAGVISVSGRARQDRAACVRAFARLAGAQVAEVAARYYDEPNLETGAAYREICMPFLSTSHGHTAAAFGQQMEITNRELMNHWLTGEDRTFDLRDSLQNVACPSLIMTGDADPVAPVEMAEELVDVLGSRAELSVVGGAGHGVFRDHPDEFRSIIRGWAT